MVLACICAGGADVMLPGVNTQALVAFEKGMLVAVLSPGNPCPVAVGSACMSSADAASRAAIGQKGKLVEVMQVSRGYLYCKVPAWQVV